MNFAFSRFVWPEVTTPRASQKIFPLYTAGMKKMGVVLAMFLFLINPNIACDTGPEFQYGESEMRTAVEGTWRVTFKPITGSETYLTLRLDQRKAAEARIPHQKLLPSAHACSSRTFVSPAEACIDASQMPLTVTILDGDSEHTKAQWKGTFTISSLVFSRGRLSLSFSGQYIQAEILPDATVQSVVHSFISYPQPDNKPAVTLTRI